eukprot:12424060-Ditylum_brightwellii.AAC.1
MFFVSTSLLHLQSQNAATEFFDHVFGLVELRENHSHGRIAVSDDMYSYLKKKFQGAKEGHAFIHVGNEDRSYA